MSKRNQYTEEQKTSIVLEVLREAQTVNEIAAKYGVHPNMLSRWKQEFLERVPEVFKRGMIDAEKQLREEQERVAQLERKVGQLTCEVDWLKKNLRNLASTGDRQRIIEKKSPVSVKR